jgi:putative ABC transport system permease protein
MFSVLNAVVLRPLPYADAEELVVLSTHRIAQNQFDGTSALNMSDWRDQSASFAQMALYRRASVSYVLLTSADGPRRVHEGLVGPAFFELLGTPPLLGRKLTDEDYARQERVVLLSERLWIEQFGRSDDVLGRTVVIDDVAHSIIGVMPATFQLPLTGTLLWRPLSVTGEWWRAAQSIRDADAFEVIGRLAPGVELSDARQEMALIAARLREAHGSNRGLDVRLHPLLDHVVASQTQRGVWLASGAVVSVLLVVCANVGGLLAARTVRRRRELAVRTALGASRIRLVRQLVAESVGLWVVAVTLGVLLAGGLLRLLLTSGAAILPRLDDIGLDATALAVALLSGLVAVTVSATAPALMASRADANAALRSRQTPGRHRLQDVLVAAQIAGAMTLLVAAILLAQSFLRVRAEDPGFPAAQLIVARIDPPASPGFFFEARERLERLPEVVSVGGITDFFVRRAPDQQVTIAGRDFADADGRLPKLVVDSVTPGFFHAMDIALLEGRDFEDRDLQTDAEPVAIISEAMASRFWSGESAIGKRLEHGPSPPEDGRWTTVVGVVGDMRREGLDTAPILSVFVPRLLQRMDLIVRTSSRAEPLIPAVRHELRAIAPSLPLSSISSAERRLSDQLGTRWFETQTMVAFAAIAMILATAGIYAMLAFQVAVRSREIGIRSALGAQRRTIMAVFVGRSVRLACIGAALGIAGAISIARVLQSQLYETTAVNLPSYGVATLVVLAISTCAAWWPARQALRVSPMTVLAED